MGKEKQILPPSNVVQGIFVFFNFLFWLCGSGVCGFAIWFRVDNYSHVVSRFVTILQDQQIYDAAVYLMIAVGGFIFFFGLLGIVGGCLENPWCLSIHFFLVLVLLLAQIASGVLMIVFRSRINVQGGVSSFVKKYQHETSRDLPSSSLNYVQVKWACCGARNFTDYKVWAVDNFRKYPYTCCKFNETQKKKDWPIPIDTTKCYARGTGHRSTRGCGQLLTNWIKTRAIIFISVAFAFATFQILYAVVNGTIALPYLKSKT